MPSIRIKHILYTRIDNTNTAMTGTGEEITPNAVDKEYSGSAVILSTVTIDSINCIVVEVGTCSFSKATKVTRLHIPSTVKKLGEACFNEMISLNEVIIPSSVTEVLTWFLGGMGPKYIVFTGTKEPRCVQTYADGYISAKFTGKVIVPYNYQGTTFAKREIIRRRNVFFYKRTIIVNIKNKLRRNIFL